MSTRLAVVCAGPAAAAPPGVDPARFAAAARADTYDLVADLGGVASAVLGWPSEEVGELWPETERYDEQPLPALLAALGTSEAYEVVVLVPSDVPDLPGLVLAKVFQALGRAAVAVAPATPGPGWAALGVALPLPDWWPHSVSLNPDGAEDLVATLQEHAPRRNLILGTPGWHRLRTAADVARLDPGLEGWEQTRALLSGRPLGT